MSGEKRRDAALHEAVIDLLARVKEMGETGLFMILTYDPETRQHHAHGEPVDGPRVAVQADVLRANLDRSQLGDVQVKIVPWEPFDETGREGKTDDNG